MFIAPVATDTFTFDVAQNPMVVASTTMPVLASENTFTDGYGSIISDSMQSILKIISDCVTGNAPQKSESLALTADGKRIGFGIKDILPDITNVQNVNDKTVFVEFADGSKEVAVLKEGDTFCLETGVLICLMKKILGDMIGGGVTGSSAYNKLVKYALTKLDAEKKKKAERIKAEKEAEKEARAKERAAKAEKHRKEKEERERQIGIFAEAYKRASTEMAEDAAKNLNDALDNIKAKLDEQNL